MAALNRGAELGLRGTEFAIILWDMIYFAFSLPFYICICLYVYVYMHYLYLYYIRVYLYLYYIHIYIYLISISTSSIFNLYHLYTRMDQS